MIKIWKLRVKSEAERRYHDTIGFEEENHDIIVWKNWVRFYDECDYSHHIILRNNLDFMLMLMKLANYYVYSKNEDKSYIYHADIMGVQSQILYSIASHDQHTVDAKLKLLKALGYIEFVSPSRGSSAELNIFINEYNKDGLKIYQVKENWMHSKLVVDKVSVVEESDDGKFTKIFGPFNGSGMSEVMKNLQIQTINKVEVVPNETPNKVDVVPNNNDKLLAEVGLLMGEGISPHTPGVHQVPGTDPSIPGIGPVCLRKQSASLKNQTNKKETETAVDMSSLPTMVQSVGTIYQVETGLDLTKDDVDYINELLKISAFPQIINAIKLAKVWRSALPSNFASLSEKEQKDKVIASQPGYFLKQMGLKHVFNFIKNSPRFRKDRKKMKSTGVVSGLDEERARRTQEKIMEDIRKKRGDKPKNGK